MDAPSSPYVRATVSKLCISIKSSTVVVSNNLLITSHSRAFIFKIEAAFKLCIIISSV